jgi:hypothetical protein
MVHPHRRRRPHPDEVAGFGLVGVSELVGPLLLILIAITLAMMENFAYFMTLVIFVAAYEHLRRLRR